MAQVDSQSRCVLKSVAISDHSKLNKISSTIDQLDSGGGTNGGAGLALAYKMAEQSYVKGDVNRILLASDGDLTWA
jgi:Ca-activated chloride channel homolog